MKRRTVLAGLGTLGVGTLGYRARVDDPVSVRVWVSERAATYDGLRERVEGYLGLALEDAVGRVELSYGGEVPVPTEDAHWLLVSTEWPRLLFDGMLDGNAAPVGGVNLLVTDGDMDRAPTGAGVRHIAAVGGASTLADLPPAEETAGVVGYATRWRVAQVVLHECGHALGLDHDHGAIDLSARGPVVTPMVSSYAWAPAAIKRDQFDFEVNACGSPYPVVAPSEANLSLRYSTCARRALRQ